MSSQPILTVMPTRTSGTVAHSVKALGPACCTHPRCRSRSCIFLYRSSSFCSFRPSTFCPSGKLKSLRLNSSATDSNATGAASSCTRVPYNDCTELTMPTTHARDITAAQRLENVRYAIRDMAVLADQLARDGHKILPLNIGDPLSFDFSTPAHMIEAVHKAMRDSKNGYAASLGIEEALVAIRHEAARKKISNVQSVFVTQGVSETVDLCLTALLNPGENVLTPCPDYPLYSAVLAKLEIPLNLYDLKEEDAWQPDIDDIHKKITPQTRGIVLINPNNPTGALYSRRKLEEIAELAREHNLVVFADEIYDKLILDDGEEHVAFASIAPDVPTVTFGGLSKNYLAPGWRIGWGIVSGDASTLAPYIDGIHKLLRSRLSANQPMQYAIQAALEGPQDHQSEEHTSELQSRQYLVC